MIATLGACIGQYSLRYLDGEPRQGFFYKHLIGIVLSASLLVLSSNLLMFFLMWLATSYTLHQLLCFYPDRRQALIAARKKVIVSRLGDVALLIAIVLTYLEFRSLEFADIFAQLSTTAPSPESTQAISLIGIFLAIGALTKSAQFPFTSGYPTRWKHRRQSLRSCTPWLSTLGFLNHPPESDIPARDKRSFYLGSSRYGFCRVWCTVHDYANDIKESWLTRPLVRWDDDVRLRHWCLQHRALSYLRAQLLQSLCISCDR